MAALSSAEVFSRCNELRLEDLHTEPKHIMAVIVFTLGIGGWTVELLVVAVPWLMLKAPELPKI